jgi:hypothetical protein
MRFKQYIAALRKPGIEVNNFNLDLMDTIAKLMNINMTGSWMELYVTAT